MQRNVRKTDYICRTFEGRTKTDMKNSKTILDKLLPLLCVLALVACHPAVTLAPGSWDSAVRKSLNALLRTQAGKGAYAVFDFDKTTSVHDVSQALWVYQVEHIRFADAPAHAFLDGVPDVSRELSSGVTFADMGAMLEAEYERLNHMRNAGMSLEEVHASEVYLDFRARMFSLMEATEEVFGAEVTYFWMPALLAGFTREEARAVVRDAVRDQYGRDNLKAETWRSPDGRWGGLVERGIWVSPEMQDLYRCLEAAGIDAYVCSASLELIVEALACDPELGVGLPEERVFGLRFAPGDTLPAAYDSTYVQPIRTGKVDCIQGWMAPSHGGRGPVLVGGDSNGDVAMLTAFPEMRRGLIIDVGRRPDSAIGRLAAQARQRRNRGRYLLQPAFAPVPEGVQGGGI